VAGYGEAGHGWAWLGLTSGALNGALLLDKRQKVRYCNFGFDALLLATFAMSIPSVRASIVLLGAAAGLICLALIVPEPPANDLPGLAACQLLHPDRYCRLTYAPGTIAP